MDRCAECRFDYFGFPRGDIGDRLAALVEALALRLSETPAAFLRQHPFEGTWSVLEYGCHVRDVLRVQRQRILLAQREREPVFEPMGRDELVVTARYNDSDPTEVATELTAAADALVEVLESLDDAGWARTGVYNYPAPQVRDVDWIARHTVHEVLHHTGDVDRVLAAVLRSTEDDPRPGPGARNGSDGP